MGKYEYLYETLSEKEMLNDRVKPMPETDNINEAWTAYLNDCAKKGWELIQFQVFREYQSFSKVYHFIFRRESKL